MATLGTVYGEKADGSVTNIRTDELGKVMSIWKVRNPNQFVRIGYFSERGAKRIRKVVRDGTVRSDAT
jgi:hypothetical protein